jgi:hypothetical protein
MSDSSQKSVGERLQIWAQVVGIIAATLWGIYTFFYKEIWVPKSVPVNITMELQLRKTGDDPLKKNRDANAMIPLEMKISAKNPSSRAVYLLPNVWIAYAHKMSPVTKPFPQPNSIIVTAKEREQRLDWIAKAERTVILSTGGLFPDNILKPNEVATRSLIIYVPPNKYETVEVRAILPSVATQNTIDLEWELNEKYSPRPKMYRLGRNGERTEIQPNKDYLDPKLELQQAESSVEIALSEGPKGNVGSQEAIPPEPEGSTEEVGTQESHPPKP